MAAPHDHPTPVARLFDWMRADRNDMLLVLLYAVIASVVGLIVPITVQAMVNTIAFGVLLQPVIVLSLLVLSVLAIAALFRALQAKVVETIQERLFARTALELSHRLPRVDVSVLDDAHGPELANRFFDVITIQKSGATLLVDGTALALQVLVGTIVLAFYHPYLLAFAFVLLGAMAFVLFVLGRGAERTALAESRKKYETAAWLQEILRHPVLFKSPAAESLAEKRVYELTESYLRERRAHFRVLFRQIVGALALQVIFNSLLVAVGGYLVLKKQLTLGQLVASELIVAAVLSSFSKVGKQLESLYDMLAGFDKLGHLGDLPEEREGKGSFAAGTRGPARLRVDGIAFRYEGRDVLDGASLEVAAGERVALVGPTGSGKSTLMSLIYGLRKPTRGVIEIDGETVHTLSSDALRNSVGLVRAAEIFDGSVLDNVVAGREHVDRDGARAALESVGLWDDVKTMSEGLDTRLHSFGSSLSIGQARKLVLARAVAARPRLLVLDDSLDELDPDSREEILRYLFDPSRPWTVLVTSRDAATLRHCTSALSFEGGRVRQVPLEMLVEGGAA